MITLSSNRPLCAVAQLLLAYKTDSWETSKAKPLQYNILSSERYVDDGRATNLNIFVINFTNKTVPRKIKFFHQEIPLRFMSLLFWNLRWVLLNLVLVLSLSSPKKPGRKALIWGENVLLMERFQFRKTSKCQLRGHILAPPEELSDPKSTLGINLRIRGWFQCDLSEKKILKDAQRN